MSIIVPKTAFKAVEKVLEMKQHPSTNNIRTIVEDARRILLNTTISPKQRHAQVVDSLLNRPNSPIVLKEAVLPALAKLIWSMGCGCCADKNALEQAEFELAEIFKVPKYPDGSGYDWSKFIKP